MLFIKIGVTQVLSHLCRANVLIDGSFNDKIGFSLEMPSCTDPKRTLVTRPFLAFTQGYSSPEITEIYAKETHKERYQGMGQS